MAPPVLGPLQNSCVTARGRLELYLPAPNVHVIVMSGQMEPPHVELLIKNAEREMARTGRPQHSFHDWLGLLGYESQCRLRLTTWMVGNLDKFGETHIAQHERLVAMGVEVANLVLGSRIVTHTSLGSLFRELDRVCKQEVAEARTGA